MSEIAIHTETHGGERKSRLAHAFERPALGLKRAVILYRDAKIRLLKAKNSNRFNDISFSIIFVLTIINMLYMHNIMIYNRIKTLRTEKGLSRKDLAEAVGVNFQTIGYLERGDYNASLELAFKLAEYFNVPIDVCLLYTSPSPRDLSTSRMPSSA